MTDVAPHWPVEFARVIACIHCTTSQCPKLLRDELENIPQPGYIGSGYARRGCFWSDRTQVSALSGSRRVTASIQQRFARSSAAPPFLLTNPFAPSWTNSFPPGRYMEITSRCSNVD
jgi:hypothetical protein